MDSVAFPPQKTYNFFRVFTLFLLFFVTSRSPLSWHVRQLGIIRQGADSSTLRKRANVRNEAHEKRGLVFEGEGVGVGVGDWGRDWEGSYTANDRGGQGEGKGVGISKRQHQLARRNTRCQGCMVFLDKEKRNKYDEGCRKQQSVFLRNK